MGTSSPEDFTNDPIAAAMVRAAAKEITQPTQPLTASVSIAEMARRVGVTERTGYKKWDAEDFQIALVREFLDLNDGCEPLVDPEALGGAARAIVEDESIPISTAIRILFRATLELLVDDPREKAIAALRLYSHGDGRVAEETRQSLALVQSSWLKQISSVLDALVAKYSRYVSLRDDLTTDQMAMAAMILAERSASQIRFERNMNQERLDSQLLGRILEALLAYALVFHDDDGSHPLDKHLSRLD